MKLKSMSDALNWSMLSSLLVTVLGFLQRRDKTSRVIDCDSSLEVSPLVLLVFSCLTLTLMSSSFRLLFEEFLLDVVGITFFGAVSSGCIFLAPSSLELFPCS